MDKRIEQAIAQRKRYRDTHFPPRSGKSFLQRLKDSGQTPSENVIDNRGRGETIESIIKASEEKGRVKPRKEVEVEKELDKHDREGTTPTPTPRPNPKNKPQKLTQVTPGEWKTKDNC